MADNENLSPEEQENLTPAQKAALTRKRNAELSELGAGAQTVDSDEPDNGSTTSTQDRPNGQVELDKNNALLVAQLQAELAAAQAAAAQYEEQVIKNEDARGFVTATVDPETGEITEQ